MAPEALHRRLIVVVLGWGWLMTLLVAYHGLIMELWEEFTVSGRHHVFELILGNLHASVFSVPAFYPPIVLTVWCLKFT